MVGIGDCEARQLMRNYIHHRHILLLSPKADLIIPQRIDSRVEIVEDSC